jgi:hypothetical protein
MVRRRATAKIPVLNRPTGSSYPVAWVQVRSTWYLAWYTSIYIYIYIYQYIYSYAVATRYGGLPYPRSTRYKVREFEVASSSSSNTSLIKHYIQYQPSYQKYRKTSLSLSLSLSIYITLYLVLRYPDTQIDTVYSTIIRTGRYIYILISYIY